MRTNNTMFDAKSIGCEQNNTIFGATSIKLEQIMQCFVQAVSNPNKECNVWCKQYQMRTKNTMF